MNDIIYWLSEKDLEEIYTYSYWNNIEKEKSKAWWCESGNYESLLKYLYNTGLISELEDAISISELKEDKNRNIVIADLGAGTCWASAVLSKLSNVNMIHSVEISKHRLELLAPITFKALNGDTSKIARYVGSFYNLKFDDGSIDYIFLSQAFHHAEYPVKLLIECCRVLKNNGKIILIGEHYIDKLIFLKKMIKYFLKNRVIEIDPYKILPPDKTIGDHYYLLFQYRFYFEQFGFSFNYKFNNKINRAIYYGSKV